MTKDSDTKEKILDAAEELFSEHGLEATSIRNIVAKAGVNISAVNYHFGSKNDLILEVYKRRLGPINQARLDSLEKLEAKYQAEKIPLGEILAAFFRPHL